MIAVIDYGISNVGSVKNALDFLKVKYVIARDLKEIEKASHLIFPGVGAFGEGMRKIKQSGSLKILEREVLSKRKPFLGICLGMQLLAEVGEEGGLYKGLGWIKGKVRRIHVDERKFHLPHVGWDDVSLRDNTRLFKDVQQSVFYFIHEYFLDPKDKKIVVATCNYGEKFAVAIEKDNIFGVQFHPEKSQKNGLKVLSNFINFSPK